MDKTSESRLPLPHEPEVPPTHNINEEMVQNVKVTLRKKLQQIPERDPVATAVYNPENPDIKREMVNKVTDHMQKYKIKIGGRMQTVTYDPQSKNRLCSKVQFVVDPPPNKDDDLFIPYKVKDRPIRKRDKAPSIPTIFPHLPRPSQAFRGMQALKEENRQLRTQLALKRTRMESLMKEKIAAEKVYTILLNLQDFPFRAKDVLSLEGIAGKIVTMTHENRALKEEITRMRKGGIMEEPSRRSRKERSMSVVDTTLHQRLPSRMSMQSIPEEQNICEEARVKSLERKLFDTLNRYQQAMHALKLHRKALKLEIGYDVKVEDILKKGATWRGRAQEVFMMKRKLLSLEARFKQNLTPKDAPYDDLKFPSVLPDEHHMKNLDSIIQHRRMKYEMADREARESKEKLADSERKLLSVNARLTALQFYIMELRTLVEEARLKTENYEAVIAQLMNERDFFERKMHDGKQEAWKESKKVEDLTREIAQKTVVFDTQRKGMERSISNAMKYREGLEDMMRQLKQDMVVTTSRKLQRTHSLPELTGQFATYLETEQQKQVDVTRSVEDFFRMLTDYRAFQDSGLSQFDAALLPGGSHQHNAAQPPKKHGSASSGADKQQKVRVKSVPSTDDEQFGSPEKTGKNKMAFAAAGQFEVPSNARSSWSSSGSRGSVISVGSGSSMKVMNRAGSLGFKMEAMRRIARKY